jgi:hypothetical protein
VPAATTLAPSRNAIRIFQLESGAPEEVAYEDGYRGGYVGVALILFNSLPRLVRVCDDQE